MPDLPTPFVGREPLLAAMTDKLAAGMVALWGPPGVGKTRLALAVDPGAIRVDLRGVMDEEAVVVRLLQALGAAAQGDLDGRLGTILARTGAVLIADGLQVRLPIERVRSWLSGEDPGGDTGGDAGGDTGERRPRLVAVTTQLSCVEGWPVLEVPPLALPEATRLLLRLVPGAQQEALCAIAARVDGLPLALVLLAPRIRALGPQVVSAALQSRGTGAPGGLGALDRVLDESWELSGPARQVLAALSVPGIPFDFAAAAALVGSQDPSADPLDPIERLIDNALLRQVDGRLSVPHVVRTYALRRSPPDEIARAERAWVRHAQQRVRDAYPGYEERGDTGCVARLLEDEPLVRRTLELVDDPLERIELLLALEPATLRRGPYPPHIDALRRALEAAEADSEERIPWLARGHRLLGELLVYVQRLEEAKEALETARHRSEQSGRPELVVRAAIGRAWLALHQGQASLADEILASAASGAEGIPSRLVRDRLVAHVCCLQALLYKQRGQLSRAADLNHRAARLARAVGNETMEAMALRNCGEDLAEAGEAERARAFLEDALAIVRRLSDRRGEAAALGTLGVVHIERGDEASAEQTLRAAMSLAAELGDRWYEGILATYLGLAVLLQGEAARARGLLERAAALQVRNRGQVVLAFTLGLRAVAHALLDRPEAAEEDLSAAQRLAQELSHSPLSAVLSLLAPVVGAARARALALAGETAAARHAWERALAGRSDGGAAAASSYDVRLAARLQRRALAAPPVLAPSPDQENAAPGLGVTEIALDGDWFLREGSRCELAARAALRRLLAHLARSHLERPGTALGVEELFAAGWPGERVARTAARNRVYSAIYTLRKLGLDALQRRDDGWCLDPDAPIRISEG